MYFLTALVLAVVGGFNPNFSLLSESPKKYFWGWFWRAFLFVGPLWLYMYFWTPALTGPFWGMTLELFILFTVNMIVSTCIRAHRNGKAAEARRERSYRGERADKAKEPLAVPPGIIVPVLFLFLALCLWISSWGMFTAKTRYGLIGTVQQRQWADDMAPVNESHLRMVSLQQARWATKQALSDDKNPDAVGLGSRYQPGTPSIQRVDGALYWIAPLEFLAFRHWQSSGTTPGYVRVSAEDPMKRGELVTKLNGQPLKLRYMPSACFGDNLERHLYSHGFRSVRLEDMHFELDEEKGLGGGAYGQHQQES